MSKRAQRGLIIIGIVLLPFIIGLLFTFELIKVNFPTDMEKQPSIGYQEGPRLLPNEDSVPVQGIVMIIDTLPSNPIQADKISLQRGEILYMIHCELCHGSSGRGDGPLTEYYPERIPSDLTAKYIAAQFDGTIFRTLNQGFGLMPPLSENITTRERWDVINYLRVLQE